MSKISKVYTIMLLSYMDGKMSIFDKNSDLLLKSFQFLEEEKL